MKRLFRPFLSVMLDIVKDTHALAFEFHKSLAVCSASSASVADTAASQRSHLHTSAPNGERKTPKSMGSTGRRNPPKSPLSTQDGTSRNTEMVKEAGPRLRYPASWLPLAAGANSRNLGPIFFYHLCTMGHPLRNESRGAGSASQYTEHNFSYTEIWNQRHRIRSGEVAPYFT